MLKTNLAKYGKEIEAYLTTSNVIGIVFLDSALNITVCNLGFMRLFNPRQNPAGAPLSDFFEIDGENLRSGEELRLPCSAKSGRNGIIYCYLIKTENGQLLICERLVLTESHALEEMGVMNDELINLQRELVKKSRVETKLRHQLDSRIIELESALNRIKRLEGIISICMYCKKIRNEQESWEQLEKYITDHTDTLFSHGICPDCVKKHYPDADQI